MSVRIGHASQDEHGRATGGSAGDQTGKELCIRQWYKNMCLLHPSIAKFTPKYWF